MTPAIALLLRTFAIGLAVAMPVGAMAILCVDRTLAHGWRAGISTGAGIATADGLYASLAAFGVSAVTGLLVSWQTPLRLVGGAALVFLGIKTMLAEKKTATAAKGRASSSPAGWYASSVALTLTNPMTIMAFAGVFMGAGLVTAKPIEAAMATLGVLCGSFTWWLTLSTVVAATRNGLREVHVVWLGRASGLALAAFGVYAAASAVMR